MIMLSTHGTIGLGPADENIVFMKRRDVLGIHRNGSIATYSAERAEPSDFFRVGNQTQNITEWFTIRRAV